MPSATTWARSGCLHVEAIACDMNADFERAFLKRCPHIVYEYFHLVKNFNEKLQREGDLGCQKGRAGKA